MTYKMFFDASTRLPQERHSKWPDGTFHLPEIMGGGVALLDYDNDGDLDILQAPCPAPGSGVQAVAPRLLQQQSDGSFVDVSKPAGLTTGGFGQGVALGDVDNDGDLDIYITNNGGDTFFRNMGGGAFQEATKAAGFTGEEWSVSAAFFDYDLDGDLDLYVTHYLNYQEAAQCYGTDRARDFCGPSSFDGVVDSLYENIGNGKFTDVTSRAGIRIPGKGLGVVCSELTGDEHVDIYVANDGEPNQLWVNLGDGTFIDEAVARGVAFNGHGAAEASMGVAVGDANDDMNADLFVSHLRRETNTLSLNRNHVFVDASSISGLSSADLPHTGFGCAFLDFDNDGDLDLAIANGSVKRSDRVHASKSARFWTSYAEKNLLFENSGRGEFRAVSEMAGDFGDKYEVSRGLAVGDVDRDGYLDLVVCQVDNSLRLYLNKAHTPLHHWLGVRAIVENRDAFGARVVASVNGQRLLAREVQSSYSYASGSEPVAHFGLRHDDKIDWLDITWPGGNRERFNVDVVDCEFVARKGQGRLP